MQTYGNGLGKNALERSLQSNPCDPEYPSYILTSAESIEFFSAISGAQTN